MSNYNNFENEQYSNESTLPRSQDKRVIEIPVIHSSSKPKETASYSPKSSAYTNSQYQAHPHQHYNQQKQQQPHNPIDPFYNYSKSPSRFDNFDSAFGRRIFPDPFIQPEVDDFFNKPFQSELFSDRPVPNLFDRFEADSLINPKLQTNTRISPSVSPKLSPNLQKKKPQQDPITIPVNYVPSYSNSNYSNIERENVDLPFGSYNKASNQSHFSRQEPESDKKPFTNYRQPSPQPQSQSRYTEPKNAKERSPSPKKQTLTNPTDMGSSTSNLKQQPQKQKESDYNQSSFVNLAAEAAGFQSPPRSTTPQLKPKTSQEKIDEISFKINNLDKDVMNYAGNNENKKDKQFLLLEESLVQCLLKLDEIDRDDDKINQLRKKLIGETQKIIDKLEAKIVIQSDTTNEDEKQTSDVKSNNQYEIKE